MAFICLFLVFGAKMSVDEAKDKNQLVVSDEGGDSSFRRIIQPMLNASCVSCHMDGTASANLNLQPGKSYKSLVGVKSTGSPLDLVRPGEPESSYLMYKILGTHTSVGDSGSTMPLGSSGASAELMKSVKKNGTKTALRTISSWKLCHQESHFGVFQ